MSSVEIVKKEQPVNIESFTLASKRLKRSDPIVEKFLSDYLDLFIESKFSACLNFNPELKSVLKKAGANMLDVMPVFSMEISFLTVLDEKMTSVLWNAILPDACQIKNPVESFAKNQSFRETMMRVYHTGTASERDLILLFFLQQLETMCCHMIHSEFKCLETNPVVRTELLNTGFNTIAKHLPDYDAKFRPWTYFQSDVRNSMADVVHRLSPKHIDD